MENAHDHLDTAFSIFCVSFLFPKLGVCFVFFRVCMDDLVKTLQSVAGMHLSGRRTLNKSLWAAQTLKPMAGMHLSFGIVLGSFSENVMQVQKFSASEQKMRNA